MVVVVVEVVEEDPGEEGTCAGGEYVGVILIGILSGSGTQLELKQLELMLPERGAHKFCVDCERVSAVTAVVVGSFLT